MAEFIVTDPNGKEHVVTAPDGATQDQALAYAKQQFGETPGGAATGNPNLRRQGDKQLRDFGSLEPVLDIGGAAALGGAMGAFSPEILTAAGNAAGAIPGPAGSVIGGALKSAGTVLKAGGRFAPTFAGALSGAAGETAGQVAEVGGASPMQAEGARIVGGMVGPEPVNMGIQVLRKYAAVPALGLMSKFKHEAAKTLIQKIDSGGFESLTDKEKALYTRLTGELRDGQKSDASLEKVGNALGDYADAKTQGAAIDLGTAQTRLDTVGRVAPIPPAELADTGERLRNVIVQRNSKAKEANDALYKANEIARNEIVSANEAAGKYINKTPEFETLVNDLKSNLEAGKRSPDVQGTYKYILGQIQSGGKDVFGQPKPISFQALDDVRRNLGEVFRGNPPEGYAAIAANDARKYYSQISNIQKKYAGGESGPQAQLLDDYARGKEGLELFVSPKGRKATALDKYNDAEFSTDASKLPDTYFSTRAGVKALKQLTGDETMVNYSAMEYINKKLEGATADEAKKFMVANREWLNEVPRARAMVENYATKVEGAERGLARAKEFVAEATSTSEALLGKRFPADRVKNLVMSGNTDLWAKAGPAIAATPDGRANILSAVRQVLADKPVTPDTFNRTIRPALKASGLADDAALDMISSKLADIRAMKIPETEKLGIYRRAALQAMAGYSASAMARGAVEAAKYVPD